MTRPGYAALLGAIRFLAVYFALQAFAYAPSMRLTWRGLIGVATVALFSVMVAAFSARHRGSGRLPRVSLGVLGVGLLAVNAFLGLTLPLAIFGAVFGIVALAGLVLFRPSMHTRPLVGLLVHLPVRVVLLGYAIVIFGADFGFEQLLYEEVALLVGVLAADAVRDAAVTPPGRVGTWLLALVCALLAAIGAAGMVRVSLLLELGLGYWMFVGLGTAAVLAASVRMLFAPAGATGLLRNAARMYRLALLAGLVVILISTKGGLGWMEGEPWYTF
ncbi:hypothetical protein [Haliangium ochraceum]|uniref:Uncharacterized protein n=1 Tax=Haliangium ochraceum (strain DSM 14365 / JCM 11303 / SMP-2) TaxID=502025 RepID=D0LYF3_HALO1|nr:hypothetical protein [Haliangium ochraceum]ACY16303.1 hypothetical protein Hoch_3803 [Haliangium ochraceum DSM 14365]